jgi:hypothetical protein
MKQTLVPSFALVAALAACGGSRSKVGEPTADAVPTGHYGCRITQGGWAYDFYACDVRKEGGALVIEKIEGQMRFKGTISPADAGALAFRGEVWCTWDEGCKGSTSGTLAAVDGGWEGVLEAYPMASGDSMSPMTIAVYRESVLESAGGTRYGGYGEGGWKGGGYTGEVQGD